MDEPFIPELFARAIDEKGVLGDVLLDREGAVAYVKDTAGHEHREKGEGGGQFTSTGNISTKDQMGASSAQIIDAIRGQNNLIRLGDRTYTADAFRIQDGKPQIRSFGTWNDLEQADLDALSGQVEIETKKPATRRGKPSPSDGRDPVVQLADIPSLAKTAMEMVDRGGDYKDVAQAISEKTGTKVTKEAARYLHTFEDFRHEKNVAFPEATRPELSLNEQGAVFHYVNSEGEYDQHLLHALARTKPFEEPVTTGRGLDIDSQEALASFVESLKSGELAWDNPASTSIGMSFEGNVKLKIVVRQGLDVSYWGGNTGEFLLPPGAYLVRSFDFDPVKKRIKAELEQVVKLPAPHL